MSPKSNCRVRLGLFLGGVIFGLFFFFPHTSHADVSVQSSSFLKPTSAGSHSITNVGFRPAAVIFYATLQASVGTLNGDIGFGVGFAASSSNSITGGAIAMSSEGASAADTYTYASSSREILLVDGLTGAVVGAADVTSFNDTGFTLNWLTANATAYLIHYIAVGGDDITAATSGQFSVTPGTGASSTTSVGFRPDFLMFIGAGVTSTVKQNVAESSGSFSLGMAASSSQGSIEQAGWGILTNDANTTSDTCSTQISTSAIVIAGPAGVLNCPVRNALASITSFDSSGFTFNKSDGPAVSSTFFYLAIKGGNHQVGSFLAPTSAGVSSTAGVGHTPALLFLTGNSKAASGAATIDASMFMGSATSTLSGESISFFDDDGDGTPDPDVRTISSSTASSTSYMTANGSVDGEAALSAFNSDGFSLNWSNAPTAATQMLYWTASHNPAVTISSVGSQTGTLSISSVDQHIGGAFTIRRNTSSTNITSITITENGTVDGSTGLDNIKLYYDADTSAPYDCDAESYGDGATQYGSTDTDGFSGANGTATFTGSVSVGMAETICMYVVLDVTGSAGDGETIDIYIANSGDVSIGSGNKTGSFPVEISGTTTLFVPVITTFLGDGTDPSNATIAPETNATSVDAFTFSTDSGTDSITQVTTTLASNTTSGIFKIEIISATGSLVYGSTTNPLLSDISITLDTPISVTTATSTYYIRVTPNTHANMPLASLGVEYAVTATITGWTGTNSTKSGTDVDSATITIDNLSPGNAVSGTATSGVNSVTISWINSSSSDYATTIVFRSSSSVIGDFLPTEGATYATGTSINSTTSVACVVTGSASTSVTCTDSLLSNTTAYYYKIFSRDSRGNYSTGAVPSGSPITPLSAIIGFLLESHAVGQVSDLFDIQGGSLTNAVFLRFRISLATSSVTFTTTTIQITNSNGFSAGNLSNFRLYHDANSDGDLDAGETPLHSTGTVTLGSSTGTIVLGGTTWDSTTTRDIILIGSIGGINKSDFLTLLVTGENIQAVGVAGSGGIRGKNHNKAGSEGSGGSDPVEQPPNAPELSGGDAGGGGGETSPPGGGSETGGGDAGSGGGSGGAP